MIAAVMTLLRGLLRQRGYVALALTTLMITVVAADARVVITNRSPQ